MKGIIKVSLRVREGGLRLRSLSFIRRVRLIKWHVDDGVAIAYSSVGTLLGLTIVGTLLGWTVVGTLLGCTVVGTLGT